LAYLIDRRLQGRNKSAGNRERFLRRYQGQLKAAVARAVKDRSITDFDKGEKVSIPVKDISEPTFGHAHGGVWETVRPGNRDYQKGDLIARPGGGAGAGRGKAGNSDDTTEDEFAFELSREEFMNVFFEDLALPNLVKTQLASLVECRPQRAGYTMSGTPANIDVLRSMRGALGRRIALGAKARKRLRAAQSELDALQQTGPADAPRLAAPRQEIAQRRTRPNRNPFP